MVRVSPNAPEWMQTFVRDLNRELGRATPVQLEEFDDSDALPEPSDYRACVAYLADIEVTVFSDGTNWRRTDTGATV